jgi:hypothetical protein
MIVPVPVRGFVRRLEGATLLEAAGEP